ncbi:MAG: hypothetical protein GDA43_25065, partial [Hormoscilla sp. SP5CHS1]|nr:hypothetical protein [Hormoscilla sp. SP5CHS1]
MRDRRITFLISGLLLIVASVLSIVVLWQLQSLLIILMISVVLADSISPLVETAERWHIPRWLGTIVVYLTLLQLVRYLISTITAFSKPVLKRICSHQHQSKFNSIRASSINCSSASIARVGNILTSDLTVDHNISI